MHVTPVPILQDLTPCKASVASRPLICDCDFAVTTVSLIITGLTFQTNLSTLGTLLTSYNAEFNRLAVDVHSPALSTLHLGLRSS